LLIPIFVSSVYVSNQTDVILEAEMTPVIANVAIVSSAVGESDQPSAPMNQV
jgi:hypothetical protein